MNAIPSWFEKRVFHGVLFLLGLQLPRAPALDAYSVAMGWAKVLWARSPEWDETLDNARLYHAFNDLAACSRHWPTARDLLQTMAPRAISDPLAQRSLRVSMTPMLYRRREEPHAAKMGLRDRVGGSLLASNDVAQRLYA